MSGRRLSVRTRLSVLIGALLLVSGALLLGVNYLLVSGALPVPPDQAPTSVAPPPGGEERLVPDREGDSGTRVHEVDIQGYRSDMLRTLLIQSGVTLAGSAVVALLLGRLAASGMLRPVHHVVAMARRLSADELDQRIRMQGPKDELTELADTFDGMLDRLARSFDSQRRFVANASHELRTPLATQRTMVEVAMTRLGKDRAARELCEKLLVVNARSEALIEGLLVLANSDRGLERTQPVRLDRIVVQVVDAHRPALEQAGVRLHAASAPRTVPGDPVLLERLVTNLVGNAIKYNDGGAVWVRVGAEPALEVANTGPPVPADRVPSLFEPFVRLRSERVGADRGVGLGLSIVASVVRAHGGAVRAEPRDGGGLTVGVSLP
ncbi:sensor histidine kinase [Saccharothrix syringae]|uniref:histidine kinase n=1 Tax=Saccharothrix syringae TaxID=103733 RepID=A0A5Q0GT65_SACSY|nr:HAMP domain-containing sensor histidine kinase [Saccharothrix syringae]QFZ17159.1 HAMP domain-containing histidine kinase [Saccharothrix syringae]